jgi:hypothetical protein
MDHLRIQSAEPITDVQVYTAAGALIAQSRQTDSLTTTNWPPGVYYLKIKLQSGTLLSSRVVKQ